MWYEDWVNAIRASSLRLVSLKTFLKSGKNQSLSSKISSGSSHEIGRSLPIIFQRNWPQNRPFFPRICPWKSCEIWLFLHDLPEALYVDPHFILIKNIYTATLQLPNSFKGAMVKISKLFTSSSCKNHSWSTVMFTNVLYKIIPSYGPIK